jgi:hypothetical protein
MTWIQLTSEQAQSLYGIPAEIANNAEDIFFGMPINLPYGYDDMRPLVVFLQNKEHPDIVTLFVKTIHPESCENDDGTLINPFSVTIGGYLSLEKKDLTGLIAILSSLQNQLPPTLSQNRQAFMKIENSNLKEYHLHSEWFPNTRQEYYLQAYDPLVEQDIHSIATILKLSKSSGFSTVFLQIAQFSLQELQDPNFQPLDRGQSRINLDRNGLQELVLLLQGQIRYI